MLIGCNNQKFLDKIKQIICNTWKCEDMGEAKTVLGLNIKLDIYNNVIYLHQHQYQLLQTNH